MRIANYRGHCARVAFGDLAAIQPPRFKGSQTHRPRSFRTRPTRTWEGEVGRFYRFASRRSSSILPALFRSAVSHRGKLGTPKFRSDYLYGRTHVSIVLTGSEIFIYIRAFSRWSRKRWLKIETREFRRLEV